MLRATLVACLLLAVPLVGHAAAQAPDGPAPTVIAGDVVWDTPRNASNGLSVLPGASLTIRGTSVDFGNGKLQVEEGGKLVVESTPDASASIRGSNGWSTRILGAAWFNGTPERPLVAYGIGGIGTMAQVADGGAATMLKAFVLPGGSLTARYTSFVNYTSGIYAASNGSKKGLLDLDHVLFYSALGGGVMVGDAELRLSNATFIGMGANVYATLSEEPATIRNVTFQNSTLGIGIRDRKAIVSDVRLNHSMTCLVVYGGLADARVSNFTCEDYGGKAGVIDSWVTGSTPGRGRLVLENASVSTTYVARTGIDVGHLMRFEAKDLRVGPLPHTPYGLTVVAAVPDLDAVEFRDVGGYNVRLIDANETMAPLPDAPAGKGGPGGKGWLVAQEPVTVFATGMSGEIVEGAALRATAAGAEATPAYDDVIPPGGAQLVLDRRIIDAAGAVDDLRYTFVATKDQDAGRVADKTISDRIVLIRLSPGAVEAESRGAPGFVERPAPGPAAALVALSAALAIALRRRA